MDHLLGAVPGFVPIDDAQADPDSVDGVVTCSWVPVKPDGMIILRYGYVPNLGTISDESMRGYVEALYRTCEATLVFADPWFFSKYKRAATDEGTPRYGLLLRPLPPLLQDVYPAKPASAKHSRHL